MKRFAALVIGVGILAYLPWALAAGSRAEPVVQDRAASTVIHEQSVDDGEAPVFHQWLTPRDGGGERWTKLLPEIQNERWRDFLVDPDAQVTEYVERPEVRDVNLEPRRAISKRPTESLRQMPDDATGVLIVKFRDDARARLAVDEQVISRTGRNLRPIGRLIDRLGLTITPAFYHTEEELADLQVRAAVNSGRGQPDLAGLMHLTGPEDALVRAAQQLNQHDLVEFVEFEREYVVQYAQMVEEGACCFPAAPCQILVQELCNQAGGAWAGPDTECDDCGDDGACCVELPDGTFGCVTTESEQECLDNFEGYFQGFGTLCFDLDEDGNPDPDQPLACDGFDPDCGEAGTGNCVESNLTPFCDSNDCCTTVCAQDPFCCDELQPDDMPPGRGPQRWDAWCAQHARELCGEDLGPPGGIPECFGNSNPCFEPHEPGGCLVPSCCNVVCTADPSCCSGSWGQTCVSLAENLCTLPADPDATPNFTHLQGYLTPGGYVDELGGIPIQYDFLPTYTSAAGTRPLPGLGGEGYDLPQFEDLAQLLWDEYGIGNNPDMPGQPTARGETIRVGVVEHSAFVQPVDPETNNHEALKHVISEPGQTILNIPGTENLTGNHGSASLGVVGGREFITGIAYPAEHYFFPIVSAEEGGRFGRAMASAMQVFGPGDVLSFSIGPRGANTLASGQRSWMLLNMATDIGITCVISAGNACANLDSTAQFGDVDSDVIIVGAAYPGRDTYSPLIEDDQGGNVHNRLPFSNFCQDCPAQGEVHVGAWGILVTTAGYGDLFVGEADNPNLRTYTHTYNGTSSAAPQVAGVAARLQSFAKQFYGIPLSPLQIRNVIAGNGFFQSGVPFTRPDLVPGHTTNPCLGSWSQEATPDNIGTNPLDGNPPIAFTQLFPAAEAIISTEFFDCSTLAQSVHTIRGEYKLGNIFSICALDNSFYVINSEATSQGDSPSSMPQPWVSQLNNVTYNINGQVADLLVVSHAPQQPIFGLNITYVGTVASVPTFNFVQVYDWDANIWVHGGFAQGAPGVPFVVFTPSQFLFNPNRFVRNSDGAVLTRAWSFAFSGPAGPTEPADVSFELLIDLVDVNFSSPGVVPEG